MAEPGYIIGEVQETAPSFGRFSKPATLKDMM